jgi:PAS domain S-box-containing protein
MPVFHYLASRHGSLLILKSLVLVSLIIFSEPSAAADPDATHVTLQLRWKHQFQFAGYYAALHKGYYEEAGLVVDIVPGGLGSKPVVQEVLSGRAQYGVTNSEIILHRAQGKPLVMLAAVFQHSPLVFVTRRSTGIQSLHDLIGKRVRMTTGPRDVELQATLASGGIGLDKLQITEGINSKDDYIDPANDALSAYVTNQPYYLIQEGIAYNLIKPADHGVDFYGDCLFTSEQQVEQYPGQVAAFRAASLKGWHYAMEHPEEIIRLIQTKYRPEKSPDHLRYEAKAMQDLINPQLVDIGHINPSRLDHIARIFARYDLVPAQYTLKGLVYDPGPKPLPAWIKWLVLCFLGILLISTLIILLQARFNRLLQGQIAERKRSEEALKLSEERYRRLVDSSPIPILVHDAEGILFSNRAAARALASPGTGQLMGRGLWSGLPEDEGQRIKHELEKLCQGQIRSINREYTWLRVDRRRIEVEVMALQVDFRGRPAAQVVFNDISERKRASRALKASENKLRGIIENSTILFYSRTPDGDFSYLSPQAKEVLDLDPGQRQPDWTEMISDHPDNQKGRELVKNALESGEKPSAYEIELLTPKGRQVWVEIHETPMTQDGLITQVIGSMTDITVRKAAESEKALLEDQLRQSQKMEALGTLAGGVAHEFNNILAAMLGYAELAQDKDLEMQSVQGELSQIVKAVQRAKLLVQQILTFSRRAEPELRPLNLNQVVDQCQQILEGTLSKMIVLGTRLDNSLDTINGDPEQIKQVIINLASNARDAMPGGGRLEISTRNLPVAEGQAAEIKGLAPGDYVVLDVMDTGSGMSSEIQQHIFEPFFSTREVGQGSGLGLSTVYGIVQNHDGRIQVHSELGQGSTFSVYFPVLPELKVDKAIQSAPSDARPGAGKTVLLVDDEQAILYMSSEFLNRAGYDLIKASTGEEGLNLFRQNKDRIDLVILDIGMPGMGGKRALAEFMRIDPKVKVLIASGYSQRETVEEVLGQGALDFVAKPYSKNEFLAKVGRLTAS